MTQFLKHTIFILADNSEMLNASCFQLQTGLKIIHCSWVFVPPPRSVSVPVYVCGQLIDVKTVYGSNLLLDVFDIPFDTEFIVEIREFEIALVLLSKCCRFSN